MDDQREKASHLTEDLIASELQGYRRLWFRDSGFVLFIVSVGLWACVILFLIAVGWPELVGADLRRPLYLAVAIASGVWLSGAIGGFVLTIKTALVMRSEANYLSKRAIVALMEYLDEQNDEEPPELRFESKRFSQ